MNPRTRRLLLSTITAVSLLTLSACHHKAATPSPSPSTTSAAPSTPPASGAASGTASSMGSSGGHQASGTKKGSMANACGASKGS